MGLFRNVAAVKPYPGNEAEAVLGVLMSVIAADGDISQDEADSFMYLANKTKLLGPMPASTFWEHVQTCQSLLRREGADALMERCTPKITGANRQPAFINACDLIMRDGRVEPEEEQIIEKLQRRLEIEDDAAQQIVQLVLAKYSL